MISNRLLNSEQNFSFEMSISSCPKLSLIRYSYSARKQRNSDSVFLISNRKRQRIRLIYYLYVEFGFRFSSSIEREKRILLPLISSLAIFHSRLFCTSPLDSCDWLSCVQCARKRRWRSKRSNRPTLTSKYKNVWDRERKTDTAAQPHSYCSRTHTISASSLVFVLARSIRIGSFGACEILNWLIDSIHLWLAFLN